MGNDTQNNGHEEPYRFFTQKEIDSILREGSRHGRSGSHAAITKILEHEPAIERSDLWKRIRQLKRPPHKPTRHRIIWSAEDDLLLRNGYRLGGAQKREAIRQVRGHHPDWEPSAVWKRAKKLGLVPNSSGDQERKRQRRWSEDEDMKLIGLAGEMKLETIAKRLGRSERAIACRLAWWGKRRRVHNEGYARTSLAQELHMGWTTIQRLIIDGFLEVRDPRITKESLAILRHTDSATSTKPPETVVPSVQSLTPSGSGKPCRAKRVWAAVAATSNVGFATVEKLIVRGVLKMCDPRVTESSLQKFCRRYGAAINRDFLPEDTRAWLRTCMEFDPTAGREVARRFAAHREHAMTVRTCETCGRSIRGNAFFRHFKECQGKETPDRPRAQEMGWSE